MGVVSVAPGVMTWPPLDRVRVMGFGLSRSTVTVEVTRAVEKEVTVEVTRLVKHPRYAKYVRRKKTYKAHDEGNECRTNDTVVIEESRPLSRTKRWTVIERR